MEQGGTKMVEPNWNRKREGGERGSDREKRSSAGGSQIRKGLYKGEDEARIEGRGKIFCEKGPRVPSALIFLRENKSCLN